MKNLFKRCKYALCVALAAMLAATMVACTNDPNRKPPEPEPAIVVTIVDGGVSTIKEKETVTLTVTVENTDNKEVKWTSSDPTILKVTDEGVVSIIKEPDLLDKTVSITATSKADERISASKTFIVKAKKRDGQSGYLTDAMIYALGNENITVDGTVTDYYENSNDSSQNEQKAYDTQVSMAEGKWSGAWGYHDPASDERNLSIVNTYVKGDEDGVKDELGRSGHGIYELHLDKNNHVARKLLKNYVSIPVVWEYQHYWNHISSLPAEEFSYDPDQPFEYIYEVGESEESQYLMAYLAFSLTPFLDGDDMFQRVKFTIESDETGDNFSIVGMEAQTYASYINPTYSQTGALVGYDAREYTICAFTFSKIGTTTIAEPTPYEASEHNDKLKAALDKMKTAKNYTYTAVDTTTSAPSTDTGDYDIMSASTVSSRAAARATEEPTTVKNYTSAISPINRTAVGAKGMITENAILNQRVTKYTASMDDKLYKIDFNGYKQITDGANAYYEEFEYAGDAIPDGLDDKGNKKYIGAMKGTKSVYGTLSEVLPTFDFAPELFKYNEARSTNTKFVFELRETAVSRDIAMEISMYNYASDASASVTQKFTITVDANGNLLSSTYPYSVTHGTYLGYVTTTYSDVGTTTLKDDTFNNYVVRGWRTSWDQYTMKYYQESKDDRSHEENAGVAARSIFAQNNNIASLPTPAHFQKLFGDDLSGPFYDSTTKPDASGEDKYIRYMSLTARTSKYDENSVITNYDEIHDIADKLFVTELGFDIVRQYTDVSGGASGRSNRYLVYDNGHITVVIENNFTKNFWIYIYNSGDYSRNVSTNI